MSPVPVDPYTFANGPGNVADGVQVNERFDPLYEALDGALDDDNLVAGFRAAAAAQRATSNQSIPNLVWTAIAFDTELHDNDGIFVIGAPTRLTIQTDGIYVFSGFFVFDTDPTPGDGAAAGIRKNGSAAASGYVAEQTVDTRTAISAGAGGVALNVTSAPVSCVAGDYFELMAIQALSGAAALNVLAGDAAGHHADFGCFRVA